MVSTLFNGRLALLLVAAAAFTLSACDSGEPDDDGAGEEEVISLVRLTFSPQGGGAAVAADARFDEASVLQTTDTIRLQAGTTYAVSIDLQNTFEDPPEIITAEVRDEEPGAHRFFYTPEGGVAGRLAVSNLDRDPNGDPLGITFTAAASSGPAASGTFRVKLRHYEEDAVLPRDKRNDTADAAEVPGVVENDLNFTFPVQIAASTSAVAANWPRRLSPLAARAASGTPSRRTPPGWTGRRSSH